MGPLVLATQMATGLGVVAGAMLLKAAEEHRLHLPPASSGGPCTWRQQCPKCSGTGKVECLCSRWSDGDRGCRTCAGTGRMACNNCRGSGSGRTAPIRISVRSNRSSF
ncbi:uncharacterized protein LOC110018900 [Phalaenopsis equestris]|uniref:uncharacterized protein LOC110018900 n=1 Tax=Phalaenopsis equestris TaxID=78828 RepID=UPI0009E47A3B|nr:uncharacterized protein LOC110018900 [Phalaenopsis equestris]